MLSQARIASSKLSLSISSPLTCLFALMFLVAGCDMATDANDEPGENEVFMDGHSFSPSTLEVEAGTTVTWVNTNNEAHTVTSGSHDGDADGEFDSGTMEPGDEFSYEFDKEGTYDYFCIPHVDQGMTGTIVVTSGS